MIRYKETQIIISEHVDVTGIIQRKKIARIRSAVFFFYTITGKK